MNIPKGTAWMTRKPIKPGGEHAFYRRAEGGMWRWREGEWTLMDEIYTIYTDAWFERQPEAFMRPQAQAPRPNEGLLAATARNYGLRDSDLPGIAAARRVPKPQPFEASTLVPIYRPSDDQLLVTWQPRRHL
jgi:hypothetical protein